MSKRPQDGLTRNGIIFNLTPMDLKFLDRRSRVKALYPGSRRVASVRLKNMAEGGRIGEGLQQTLTELRRLNTRAYERTGWLNGRLPLMGLRAESRGKLRSLMRACKQYLEGGDAALEGFPEHLGLPHSQVRQDTLKQRYPDLEWEPIDLTNYYIVTFEVALVAAEALTPKERETVLIPVMPSPKNGEHQGYRGLLPLSEIWNLN